MSLTISIDNYINDSDITNADKRPFLKKITPYKGTIITVAFCLAIDHFGTIPLFEGVQILAPHFWRVDAPADEINNQQVIVVFSEKRPQGRHLARRSANQDFLPLLNQILYLEVKPFTGTLQIL